MTKEQKNILGIIAVISLMAILFTEINTNQWRIPMLTGLIFGTLWYFKK